MHSTAELITEILEAKRQLYKPETGRLTAKLISKGDSDTWIELAHHGRKTFRHLNVRTTALRP
jgi:hypothetical protein